MVLEVAVLEEPNKRHLCFFPDDVNLPDAKADDIDVNIKRLLNWNNKLQSYWKASPYLLEDTTLKKSQMTDVARFSDKQKTMFTRDSLSQVLVLNDFPKELIQGTRQTPSRKKFRWNPESEIKSLDSLFDKLEKRDQRQVNESEKEKKGEDEDEDENAENEEDVGDPSDDDYN